MISIEIIVHAWSGPNAQYAKLLNYQLSSLVINPPERCHVTISIVHALEPGFADLPVYDVISLRENFDRPNIWIRDFSVRRSELFQRPLWRNELALQTEADIVWFADCDYVFGPGCLDALADCFTNGQMEESPLYYPRRTLFNKTFALGDEYIHRVAELDKLHDIDPADFKEKREDMAIGGIQIVPGDVARERGYCREVAKYQRPKDLSRMRRQTIEGFRADKKYRKLLGTPGVSLPIGNLFRIRHSENGDGRVPTEAIAKTGI